MAQPIPTVGLIPNPLGGIFGSTVFTPGQMIYCDPANTGTFVPVKVATVSTDANGKKLVTIDIPGLPTIAASACRENP